MKLTLEGTKQNVVNSSTSSLSRIRLKDNSCLPGTVPIKRITKDDLIRQINMPPPEDVTFNAQLIADNNNSELKGTYIASQGYKMKPTLFRAKKKSENSSTTPSSRTWLKGIGCPLGTVPIKRITKEDLIRQKSMPPSENVIFDDRWATVAIARTPINPNNKFAGGGMSASIWNPHVEGQQHSACRLKIQKEQDIIQVGWRVDPILYGNTQTRLFIHFQAGKKHCFNILCPGFVIVSHEIPVDMLYDQVSHRGDNTSLEDEMGISRDLVNGNWWLLMEDNHIKVGFWPQRIFTSLTSFATDVEWGGVVYSPPGVPEPPMGSSFFPVNDTTYDAYCSGLQVLNAKGEMIDVDRVITHVDDTNLYKIVDYPHASPGKFQHYILYGGPGENA
ncbi:hypothetical protein MTR67_037298 [Solanum verrucosum]|uniref:Neprosin PEP catalytic domain-containing protein n=1 Tax=Solanum verrucosum TaxID=315347 RepID=A0AAF0UD90_SOLVR|nr:hypothetical protein MTR67_037298 [Solanum verrucosum]